MNKYQEDQCNNTADPKSPEYAVNEEVIQKVTQFFGDNTESDLILDHNEAYIVSWIQAYKNLECDEISGVRVNIFISNSYFV